MKSRIITQQAVELILTTEEAIKLYQILDGLPLKFYSSHMNKLFVKLQEAVQQLEENKHDTTIKY